MRKRRKDTYDVSNWLLYPPLDFMMRVLPILNEKAESIAQIAAHIKKIPNIDASTPLHYPGQTHQK